nr:reverse transcriptase domain-containing protein [Tanacetum cinerariifolium]
MKAYDGTGDPKDHVKNFEAASQKKKYVKDSVEIHNIKQKDGETIEELMERFKIETGHIKGAPKCMRIFGFMHGVNNYELIKRLNEHVPKTLEEMMTTTAAFIRGETAVASKKKVYTPWKSQEYHGTRQKVTHSFTHVKEITFLPLTANKGTGGLLVIEAKISGHAVHRIYVDGGSSMEWENYMAAETVKDLGNYRGRRALYKSVDELHDSEVTITIKRVAIHPDFPDQEITIGGAVSIKTRTKLCTLLKRNLDIFAWQPSNMTGVPRSIAEHRLNIREGYSPVRQKKRGQAPKRAKAIHLEVQKLVEAGILFKKTCPQDFYPLLEIDWKIESIRGYPFKFFMYAYKGYHQIQMAEQDEEKTAFHTSHGVYCYTKIPFGLKNAGATYQRLVDQAFAKQICQNLEIYVDDLVIKSRTETELLRDIKETFRTLRKINMKFNPKNLKQHLAKLPMLVAPKPKEELIGYLFASNGAISAVLMTERDTVQTPVYFISRALQAPELNYTPMETLVLALVCAAKRLCRYFQAHLIVVITDEPIKQVTSRPNILADFLTEKSDDSSPEASVVKTL